MLRRIATKTTSTATSSCSWRGPPSQWLRPLSSSASASGGGGGDGGVTITSTKGRKPNSHFLTGDREKSASEDG